MISSPFAKTSLSLKYYSVYIFIFLICCAPQSALSKLDVAWTQQLAPYYKANSFSFRAFHAQPIKFLHTRLLESVWLNVGRSMQNYDLYRRFISIGVRYAPKPNIISGIYCSVDWVGQLKPHSNCLQLANLDYLSRPNYVSLGVEDFSPMMNWSINFHICLKPDQEMRFPKLGWSFPQEAWAETFMGVDTYCWHRFSKWTPLIGLFYRFMEHYQMDKRRSPYPFVTDGHNWGGIAELKYSFNSHVSLIGECRWDNYNQYRLGLSIELDSLPIHLKITQRTKRSLLPLQYDVHYINPETKHNPTPESPPIAQNTIV